MNLSFHRILSDRFFTSLASWSCLLGGMALLGMMVLTPSRSTLNQMQAQQRALLARAEHLQHVHASAVQIQKAMAQDDPAMLEYLAYHFMGLKPHGLLAMNQQAASHSFDLNPIQRSIKPIDAQVAPGSRRSYLVDLALGKGRWAVALLGLVGIFIGLWLMSPSQNA